MSDPILGTTGDPGAGDDVEPVLDDTAADDSETGDDEAVQAEAQQTVTNDAVSGETVLPGVGDGNDGRTGGAPGEAVPELPANELQGEDIDLDDDSRTL